MRLTMIALCLAAAACGGQMNSPTSPAMGTGGPSGTSASAGTDLPFQGSFTGTARAGDFTPTGFRITGTLEGTATHFGRFTATTVDIVDTATNSGTGTYDFTAVNGDRLFTTLVGIENEFVPPNISKVAFTGTITGGTGRFEGATGSFTVRMIEEIDYTAATSVRSGSFDGRLSLNR